MGYASRNNSLSKETKLISYNTIRDLEIIRVNPKRAYRLGLISFEQLQFIKSQPSNIEIILNELTNKR